MRDHDTDAGTLDTDDCTTSVHHAVCLHSKVNAHVRSNNYAWFAPLSLLLTVLHSDSNRDHSHQTLPAPTASEMSQQVKSGWWRIGHCDRFFLSNRLLKMYFRFVKFVLTSLTVALCVLHFLSFCVIRHICSIRTHRHDIQKNRPHAISGVIRSHCNRRLDFRTLPFTQAVLPSLPILYLPSLSYYFRFHSLILSCSRCDPLFPAKFIVFAALFSHFSFFLFFRPSIVTKSFASVICVKKLF